MHKDIIFFISNRGSTPYFEHLSKHLNLNSNVIWHKDLKWPGISCLHYLKNADLKQIVEYKILEKTNHKNSSTSQWYWNAYRTIKYLSTAYRFIVYAHYFDNHPCEAIGIWNGHKYRMSIVVQVAKALKIKVIYFENGLLPNTTTVDPKGVNSFNSLSRDTHFYKKLNFGPNQTLPDALIPRKPSEIHALKTAEIALPKQYIFVPFQIDNDSQIIIHSPWIKNMADLMNIIRATESTIENKQIYFVLKEHPAASKHFEFDNNTSNYKRIIFANGNNTQELIEKSMAIITINSTVGIESLLLNKKVITLGNAFYNIPGIVQHASKTSELTSIIADIQNWAPDTRLVNNFLRYLYFDYLVPDSYKNPTERHWESMNKKISLFIAKQ